jgi:hypothetical protein
MWRIFSKLNQDTGRAGHFRDAAEIASDIAPHRRPILFGGWINPGALMRNDLDKTVAPSVTVADEINPRRSRNQYSRSQRRLSTNPESDMPTWNWVTAVNRELIGVLRQACQRPVGFGKVYAHRRCGDRSEGQCPKHT